MDRMTTEAATGGDMALPCRCSVKRDPRFWVDEITQPCQPLSNRAARERALICVRAFVRACVGVRTY